VDDICRCLDELPNFLAPCLAFILSTLGPALTATYKQSFLLIVQQLHLHVMPKIQQADAKVNSYITKLRDLLEAAVKSRGQTWNALF
jgi:hypothetical protein